MTPTREQRAMMAADLSMRAAALLLSGDERGRAVLMGAAATMRAKPRYCAGRYQCSLSMAGLSPADIDAACEAIARGEHPADSLPGQVTEYADRWTRLAADCGGHEPHKARASAAQWVLDLLGCKVKS